MDRRQQLAATLDTAIGRLSKVGGLDDAARAALLSTLENTSPDDWPAVIDAFTSSLAAAAPRVEPEPAADTRATPADAGVAMNAAPATPPADQPEPSEPEPERGGLVFPVEPVAATVAVSDSPVLPAEPAPQAMPDQLVVSNACFASRVRAWGVVDRFATDRFRPGQDVIVYFELDNLTASESSAGHTTIIDSSLKLVDAEGRLVHEWNFDPIDETCPARRRDYFARY
ncbi:MAG: hypothetical protein EBZ59_08930, partial [Planctomycetia bacterium]|nr:hypothetical protein [Planctomycetia bacterium]